MPFIEQSCRFFISHLGPSYRTSKPPLSPGEEEEEEELDAGMGSGNGVARFFGLSSMRNRVIQRSDMITDWVRRLPVISVEHTQRSQEGKRIAGVSATLTRWSNDRFLYLSAPPKLPHPPHLCEHTRGKKEEQEG